MLAHPTVRVVVAGPYLRHAGIQAGDVVEVAVGVPVKPGDLVLAVGRTPQGDCVMAVGRLLRCQRRVMLASDWDGPPTLLGCHRGAYVVGAVTRCEHSFVP